MGARKVRHITLVRDVEPEFETKLFVIATEGEKTEPSYFLHFENSRVKIRLLSTPQDGTSSPAHVLDRIKSILSELGATERDELWIVIDTDRWTPSMLSRVLKEAKDKRIKSAVSNPCFEVWLLYHYEYCDKNGKECSFYKSELKRIATFYNSSNLDMGRFKDKVGSAITFARQTVRSGKSNWPAPGESHVFKLVERLRVG